mmetsp:Transcript_3406/g.5032  ORF Transcript_3406/g.5032 Transcript_3406/m.5032 type:complete len:93 (-) Transcript_3406:222-500(-)
MNTGRPNFLTMEVFRDIQVRQEWMSYIGKKTTPNFVAKDECILSLVAANVLAFARKKGVVNNDLSDSTATITFQITYNHGLVTIKQMTLTNL